MKKIKLITILIISVIFMNGCSFTKPKDDANKNIITQSDSPKVSSINIYYDTTDDMAKHLSDTSFFDIVYAAGSSAKDSWSASDCRFYKVSDSITEDDFDYLSSGIYSPESYSGTENKVLKSVLDNMDSDDGINIIITDLNKQITDYSGISNALINTVLSKGNAIAIIGVDTDTSPFFIIAAGENNCVSKYIETFKNNPSIKKYNEDNEDGIQVDIPQKINYQIIANKSGVLGIKYNDISFVEHGLLADENGNFTVKDTMGSFSKLNSTYDSGSLDTIEGSVNFTPDIPPMVTVKLPRHKNKDTSAKHEEENNSQQDGKKKNTLPVYLGVRSLDYKDDELAGKIKMNIPFDIIQGVKLSKLDCDVGLTILSNNGKSKFTEVERDGISATIAEGVHGVQGKWRVDDASNSIVFNINFENAANFKSDNEILKLDIDFKYYDSIDTVSEWVKTWDGTKVNNLMNLFNSLYMYQKDVNTSENGLTVYVGAGNKSLYKRATRTQTKSNERG